MRHPHTPHMRSPGSVVGIAIGITALFAAVAGGNAYYTYGTEDNVTITVEEKERVNQGSSSEYLVWAEHEDGKNEVFQVTDSLLRMMFNSSDRYGALDEGNTYNCDVYGWRIGLTSTERNIVDCDLISEGPANPAP